MMTTKPVVHFIGEPEFFHYDFYEEPTTIAKVYALDHPRLGKGVIRTSRLVKSNTDGSFETLNTIYAPKKETL